MDDLILKSEDSGVTDFARIALANDARLGTIREWRIVTDSEEHLVSGPFLATWKTYDEQTEWRALYVIMQGVDHLIHRKPDPRVGFTPFAKEKLLFPTGHAKDTKTRTYVMGGKDTDGKRVRREMSATILVVWLDYASDRQLTHLWVKWKDGKRHLVHRKGL